MARSARTILSQHGEPAGRNARVSGTGRDHPARPGAIADAERRSGHLGAGRIAHLDPLALAERRVELDLGDLERTGPDTDAEGIGIVRRFLVARGGDARDERSPCRAW